MVEVVTTDEQARHHYLVSSLMEEAIRSSQLEGATTSRRVAKELLRTGRAPRDRSERMILNNYRARSSTAEKDPAQARIHGGAKPAEGTSELATRTARHRDRPLRDGRLAGIEVKASATVRGEDFKHLAAMRDRIGDERFVRGVVLYTGGERLPFGERLEAWPLATLWTDAGA